MARLDEICTINMGQSPESSSYNETGDGLPFFQGNADFGSLHPTVRIWCNSPTKTASPGDILISVRAPIGALNIADVDCCIGRGLAALTVNERFCKKEYLWYAIAGKVKELNEKGTGSTFKAIGKSVLAETEIPLPPVNKQHYIANVLDLLNRLIFLRQQQLAKLDELVKARFVEMFVGKAKSKNLEPLSNYLEYITYGFTNPMPDTEVGPWKITAKDVVDGQINFSTARKTSVEAFSKLSAKSKPTIGSVLLTKDGTLGRTAIVENENICVNQSVAVLKCNQRVIPRFLMQLLQMPEYQQVMLANSGGGTIKHIYITKVDKMLIAVPDIALQKRFIDFVEQTDKSRLTIQQSLAKLEVLKKTLMQEYFG